MCNFISIFLADSQLNYINLTWLKIQIGKRGGVNMGYLGIQCLACSSERVDFYQAPTGVIIYECDSCGKVWNSSAYRKTS